MGAFDLIEYCVSLWRAKPASAKAGKLGFKRGLSVRPGRRALSHCRGTGEEHGVKIVINTDSHHTSHMDKIRFGILQARRAWLTKDDVLNTLPVQKLAKAMKHAW